MPINKGLGGFCFLKSVKDEIIQHKCFKIQQVFLKYTKKEIPLPENKRNIKTLQWI